MKEGRIGGLGIKVEVPAGYAEAFTGLASELNELLDRMERFGLNVRVQIEPAEGGDIRLENGCAVYDPRATGAKEARVNARPTPVNRYSFATETI